MPSYDRTALMKAFTGHRQMLEYHGLETLGPVEHIGTEPCDSLLVAFDGERFGLSIIHLYESCPFDALAALLGDSSIDIQSSVLTYAAKVADSVYQGIDWTPQHWADYAGPRYYHYGLNPEQVDAIFQRVLDQWLAV